jgi:hypothetical protein
MSCNTKILKTAFQTVEASSQSGRTEDMYIEEYLETRLEDKDLFRSKIEEERWLVRETKYGAILIDEQKVHDNLNYDNEDELVEALLNGEDERQGRYPSTDMDEGIMIYDRRDSSTFIKGSNNLCLEDMV